MDSTQYAKYLEFRPHWRAFGVYFFGVLVFYAGPFVNPDAFIPPALSEVIGTLFLGFIAVKRYTSMYRVSRDFLEAEVTVPKHRLDKVAISDITRIDLRRGLTQRMLRVAHVRIYGQDSETPVTRLFGVPEPDDFKRLLLELGASDAAVSGAFRK